MKTKRSEFLSLCDVNPSGQQIKPSLQTIPASTPSDMPLSCTVSEHAVKRRNYLVPTPPIKTAFNIACQLINARHRGAAFVGPSRIGKTCAIDYLATKLRAIFPNRIFVIFDAWEHQRPSPNAFYVDLLMGLGAKAPTAGKSDSWRDRAVNQLWLYAEESNSRHIVMLIDEAQNLHAEELGGLKNICVQLERRYGIRVSTLLWGQIQLEYECSALVAQQRGDIKARFMSPILPFHGLCSAAELSEVLTEYDNNSEYPVGSSLTFTQFFFPRAYAAGWRLASAAPTLWHAIAKVTGANADELELGMDGISAIIERLFDIYHEEDHANWKPDTKYREDAVEFSGIADLPATARASKGRGGKHHV